MSGIAAQLPSPASLGQLIERGPETSFILAILYAAAFTYAVRRLSLVYKSHRSFDLPVMLVSSVVFNLFVRLLSFVTLAVLALRNVTVSPASDADGTAVFIQHVMAVLLNTGDFTAISTYLLLGVVWVELLQKTRKHLFSNEAIRRDWLIAYIVLNCLLYALQIGLYVAVFAANTANPEVVLAAVYIVLGCLNVLLPLALLLTYGGYSIAYSGFPYRSREALQRWQRLSRLLVGWSAARFVWAAASLLAASSWALDALAGSGAWAFTVLCVALFLLGELVPFLATCGTDVLLLFGPLVGVGDGGKGGGRDAGCAGGLDDGPMSLLSGGSGRGSEALMHAGGVGGGGGGGGDEEDASGAGDMRMLGEEDDGSGGVVAMASALDHDRYSRRVGGLLVPLAAAAGVGHLGRGGVGGGRAGGPRGAGAQPIPMAQQPQWRALGALNSRSNSIPSIAASFVSARSFGEEEEEGEEQGDLALGSGSQLHVPVKKLRFAPSPQRNGRSPGPIR